MLIEFETWGTGPGRGLRGKVRVDRPGEAPRAVAVRLERETGLSVCGGPRVEGSASGATHFQVSLGRSLGRGYGYEPKSDLWFSIRNGTR